MNYIYPLSYLQVHRQQHDLSEKQKVCSSLNLALPSKNVAVRPIEATSTVSLTKPRIVGLMVLGFAALAGLRLWTTSGIDPSMGLPCVPSSTPRPFCNHGWTHDTTPNIFENITTWIRPANTTTNSCFTSELQDTFNFNEIFSNPNSRFEFNKFLDNIFPQVDAKSFNILIDDIRRCSHSDKEIYKELVKRIGYTQGGILHKGSMILRSLKKEAEATSVMVQKVMGDNPKVDGYLEIGYPGRYVLPIKEKIGITGPIVVMNSAESFTDYVQAGFPLPYDKFIPLNDYNALNETQIPTASMDLVTCFIGLHHVPESKLEDFIKSLHRVIRPGGSFILKDHDAHNSTQKAMASVVHSVFNAEGWVSVKEEMEELRYFKDLESWITLLENHGFKKVSAPLMRDGDPSLNSLIRFERIATQRELNLSAIKEGLGKDYERAGYQTYLTSIEWHDVAVAQEYANCLKQPNCEFPYFKHIQQYQDIFRESYQAAAGNLPLSDLPSSDYTTMNQFIRGKTALEFGIKGVISKTSSFFSKAASIFSFNSETTPAVKTTVEEYDAEIAQKYAHFIEHTPFYMFPFSNYSKELWEVYKKSGTLKDLPLLVYRTAELSAKSLASIPAASSYTAEENKEPETIQLIVEGAENLNLQTIDERIKVLKALPGNEFSLISIPRYRPFTEIWHKLAEKGIKGVEIAGQQKIQVKVLIPTTNENPCKNITGCKKLYDMPILSDPQNKYIALNVDVPALGQVIKDLVGKNVKITYIHDF